MAILVNITKEFEIEKYHNMLILEHCIHGRSLLLHDITAILLYFIHSY